MTEKPNLPIDFERAAVFMDVVQKVAHVAPAYTALSGVAMGKLKEYNDVAQTYLNELGKQRLAEEQAAAARINEEVAKQAKENQPKAIPANALQLKSPMPGEPVDPAIEQETDTPQFPDDPTPIERRV